MNKSKNIAILTPFPIETTQWWVEIYIKTLKNILIKDGNKVDIFDTTYFKKPSKNIFINCYKLWNIINKNNYDLVISNGYTWFSLKRKNTINIYHWNMIGLLKNSKITNIKTLIWYFVYIIAEWLSWIGKIKIAISKSVEEDLKKYYKFNNIIKINNFVNKKLFNKISETEKNKLRKKYNVPKDSFIIFYSGRWNISKWKEVIKKIINNNKIKKENIITILATDRLWDENYLDKNELVKVFEKFEHKKINELYKISDIFIFPSKFEWWWLSILEAFSTWVPVISNNVWYIKEITNKEVIDTCIIKNLKNDEWIKKIIKLKNNKKLYNKIIKENDLFIKNYSIEIFEKQFLNLIHSL